MTLEALTVSVDQPGLSHPIEGPPVFFMHIAKTAGSYLNRVFEAALGPDAVETHVEHRLGGAADLEKLLSAGRAVISGHVMNGLWENVAAEVGAEFRKVTILRDPISHIASHILWLDHYNMPEHRAGYDRLDEAHKRVVDRIGAIDLGDIGHLDHFLATFGPTEVRLFDNCQSRYFIASGRREPDLFAALTLADVKKLRSAAETFDLILCQDQLGTGVRALAAMIGVQLSAPTCRVNEARSPRQIDIGNPLVRQVLSRRTLVDQWLWRWAKRM